MFIVFHVRFEICFEETQPRGRLFFFASTNREEGINQKVLRVITRLYSCTLSLTVNGALLPRQERRLFPEWSRESGEGIKRSGGSGEKSSRSIRPAARR